MENGSESSPGDSPTSESQKLQSMAFTIHFSDTKDSGAVRPVPENLAKLVTKHKRVPSLPNVEDSKRVLSPLPARIRRAGYHSEGYFSSDQEDEHSRRGHIATDIFVKKFKNFEKGLRATNLAQEKKIFADAVSHRQQLPAGFLRDEPPPDYEFDDDDDADLMAGLDSKRHNTSLNSLPTAAAIEAQPSWDSSEDEGELQDGSDACSETGTYTIEKDAPCPEVEEARREVECAISQGPSNYNMSSLYREGSNWINEWATQVAKHNNRPNTAGLPPLPLVKHQGYTGQQQVVLTRIPSPIQRSPSGRKSASSNHQDDGGRQSDSSLETESFLRATESVVTAMQARMTLSLDSGGESDGDPVASNHKAVSAERQLGYRRPSGAGRSDSSSDTGGEIKAKHKDTPATTPAPQMRYNRAFSLRRARLDCEETPPAESRKKKPEGTTATPSPPPSSSSRIRKAPEPTKATKPVVAPAKPTTAKSSKPEAFSRTDCGRFSVRAPKQPPPVQKNVGQGAKKSGGGRSNSTLSSREVEFQNWKRRKSYDPMKAAAEGKRKEAAKKAVMSNSMTQSSISPSSQSSQLNPVLRSASFHGTAGAVLSSEEEEEEEEEEEVTLSADEDSPPLAAPSSPARTGSRASLHSNSSLRRGKLEIHVLRSPESKMSVNSTSQMKSLVALDNLVMAAVCGLSNKLRVSSCNLMKKLRYLYEEDEERAEKLTAVIELLGTQGSPQTRSPSKELSSTLKNLKRIENVFKVLDEVLFDEEDFDLDLEVPQ